MRANRGNIPLSDASLALSPRIDTLTGIRGIAALWVVLYHLGDRIQAAWPDLFFTHKLIAGGYLGVDLFSLLSGFIIAHTYCDVFAKRRPGTTKRFLWFRVARTIPLHVFVMLAFVAFVPANRGFEALGEILADGTFWRQLFLLHGVGFEEQFAWNVPSWSLSSEWACYLVFPLAAPFMARVRSGRVALVLVVGTLAALISALNAVGRPAFDAYLDYGWLRVGGEFVVGCWLERVHRSGILRKWPLGWIALVVLLTAVLAVGFTGWRMLGPIYVSIFALLILALAQQQHPWRLLTGNRVIRGLGEISYSLYMVHWLVLMNAHHFGLKLFSKQIQIFILLLAVIGVSTLTYHLIEQRGQRQLRSWLREN